MLEAGAVKEYRDLILGHSFEGMDKFYLKPPVDRLKGAMDTYTAWLDKMLDKARKKESVTQTLDFSENGVNFREFSFFCEKWGFFRVQRFCLMATVLFIFGDISLNFR